MKKAISEAKVQRMRNLVTGKYKAKTATQIGYKKTNTKRKEGEVWEEKGKTWTIKNGVRQNITKLDSLRKVVRTPLCCPRCGNRMIKKLDKKIYKLRKICFDCNLTDEHRMRLEGTYDQYERDTINKKLDTVLQNAKDYFDKFIEDVDKDYITESGLKEDWSGGLNKEQYRKLADIEIEKLKEKIENFRQEME